MVLDIGEDVGAVVIHTGADLDGAEVEVRRVGAEWDGTHVAVRSRPTAGDPVYAAVFSQLPDGEHEFRLRPPGPQESVHRIRVIGGGLVESLWEQSQVTVALAHPSPGDGASSPAWAG